MDCNVAEYKKFIENNYKDTTIFDVVTKRNIHNYLEKAIKILLPLPTT